MFHLSSSRRSPILAAMFKKYLTFVHLVERLIQYPLQRFAPSTDIASQTRVKSSVQRGIRTDLANQIPALGENDGVLLEAIWPKKEALVHVKWSVTGELELLTGV